MWRIKLLLPAQLAELMLNSADRQLAAAPEGSNLTVESELSSGQRLISEEVVEEQYNRVINSDCADCSTLLANFPCPLDGPSTCAAGHSQKPFLTYKKRVVVRKTEISADDDKETHRTEEQIVEDSVKKMDSPEEFDSDLHDKSSYGKAMSHLDGMKEKKRDRLNRVRDDSELPSPRGNYEDGATAPAMLDPDIRDLWNESVDLTDLFGAEQNEMLQLRIKLGIERISMETLARYHVRGHMDNYEKPAILYPRYKGRASRLRVPAGLKVIRKYGDRLDKMNYPLPDETLTKQRFSGIFGYHMMTASDRKVVLTTNERDALAVYEATNGILTFALPLGERLDSSVLPYLEDFEQIFLWFPSRHIDYAKDWGCVLNGSRCFLIKNAERPIELVLDGDTSAVKQILFKNAVRLRDKGFRSMTDIREEVKADLVHTRSRLTGIAQWRRFPDLNNYLIGFRPGELTVLTGSTGVGKTTFLCEYSLDLMVQGIRTLFCSFEMPEEKILKWMVVQYAAQPLYRVEFSNSIDSWLDKFERSGQLTIMKSHEFMNRTVTQIAEAIERHVINNNIQHVVIDNLQFLVNQATLPDDSSTGIDRYHHQDRFVGMMRKLCTEHQVHITMVVHPRKIDSNTELDLQHFGGSARVTQEADNVLAIQRRRDEKDRGVFRKFLYILKNRYGGRKVESDTLEMRFQKATYTHQLLDLENR